MAFRDLTEFVQPALTLPIAGREYTVPKPSLSLGLRLTRAITEQGGDIFALPVQEQWALVLGPAYDAMVSDDVPFEYIGRAFMVALADFQGGRTLAEATWEAGTNPEAVAAWLSSRAAEQTEEGQTSAETPQE